MNLILTECVLEQVFKERCRQEQLKRAGAFKHSCADSELNIFEKLAIMMEEVGEVAQAALQVNGLNSAHDSARNLKTELIQVAAVCVAWAECMEES